MLVKELCSF